MAVYHALTENASDSGSETFQSLQSHIGRLAGDISTRTVQRCLPLLREIGVIDYTTPKLRGPITFSILSVPSDSRNDAPDSRNVTTETIFPSRRTIEVTKKEPEEGTRNKRGAGIEDPDFTTFWDAYPKKIAKPKALAAWSKAKLPAICDILAAIASQSASEQWRKNGGQFIPHPATWINGERWNDSTSTGRESDHADF
ncbi:MAG: hypothetical protein WAN16_07570 [Chthoniobacterales bacterium]